MADWLEGFVPMRLHVLIRFGKWQEIIDDAAAGRSGAVLRDDGDDALRQGGGLRRHRRRREAERERALFARGARRRARDALPVQQHLPRHPGRRRARCWTASWSTARGTTTRPSPTCAARSSCDDGLPYDEPWGWMQPTRHALGALLLEQGHVEEAEAVYRADLGLDGTLPRPCQHPENVWSLHGYHECLHRLGRCDEADRSGRSWTPPSPGPTCRSRRPASAAPPSRRPAARRPGHLHADRSDPLPRLLICDGASTSPHDQLGPPPVPILEAIWEERVGMRCGASVEHLDDAVATNSS